MLLADRFPEAKVDAIERSPDAATVARFNFVQIRLGARTKLHRSDVFDTVPAARLRGWSGAGEAVSVVL